jgi:hypothetical protein
MNCTIRQETYDALKAATLAGDMTSFSFQYVHKGVDFSMESKNDNLDYDEWEDMLHEIYFNNELPEYTGFYPKIENDVLVLNIKCSVDLNYEGLSEDFWRNDKLTMLIQNELSLNMEVEIGKEDIMLNLKMNASDKDNYTLESFCLICYHPQTQQEFDLTENKIVQDKIKEIIYEWASFECKIGSRHNCSFLIEINDSIIDDFYENYSGKVELEIV